MLDHQKHNTFEPSSEKNFGIVFALVFLAIGIFPLIKGSSIILWSLIISIIFFIFAFFLPKILKRPNQLWFKFGILLGNIISPLVMGCIFFLTVVPIGLVMKLLGKDILSLKKNRNIKSYWKNKKNDTGTFKDQF